MRDPSGGCGDDIALIERLMAGEEEAAKQFYLIFGRQFRYQSKGQRLLPQDLEDLAQEAICKAVDQLLRHQYRGESRLATWLGHIIHGTLVDHFRRVRKDLRLEGFDPWQESNSDTTSRADPESLPILAYQESREESLTVGEILAQISPVHRQILLLKHLEGRTIREIALRLGMTEGQVSSKLYAAQAHFRHLFGPR
ncbi:MAG: RNA polymerase sigma factor [Blastocatellia bacterium]|jgi:RNA polymerase sigma-70 factor (ECF subfamily)